MLAQRSWDIFHHKVSLVTLSVITLCGHWVYRFLLLSFISMRKQKEKSFIHWGLSKHIWRPSLYLRLPPAGWNRPPALAQRRCPGNDTCPPSGSSFGRRCRVCSGGYSLSRRYRSQATTSRLIWWQSSIWFQNIPHCGRQRLVPLGWGQGAMNLHL